MRGEATSSVADVPPAEVAIVPGALVEPDGRMSAMLAARVRLTADLQPWGAQGEKSEVREVLSRVKAIADVTLDTPAMGGPRIPISGDGRASWGPTPPPATPPAGSPGR